MSLHKTAKQSLRLLMKLLYFSDKLLVKEVQEMEENLPSTVKTSFPDPNNLSEFYLIVQPNEGLWKDGRFKFLITINEDYNMMPPKVKCLTKVLHPNISCKIACTPPTFNF